MNASEFCRREIESMEARIYSVLFQFNYVSRQEIRKELECERQRCQREEEANPDRIYLRVATAEDIRRQRGSLPRAVILPWTRLDDDRALARIKALASSQQSAQPAPDNSRQSTLSGAGSTQT
jgi:hypothetical protein